MSPTRRTLLAVTVGLLGCSEKPIDRTAPKRSADVEDSSMAAVPSPTAPAKRDAPRHVEVDAGGRVRVDGFEAGDTSAILDSGQMRKVDDLFGRLKRRREDWKDAHPGEAFPGVVDLHVLRQTPALVLKSVFQTIAFAGYPNITIYVPGAPVGFPAEAQIPEPPFPEPEPVKVTVLHLVVGTKDAGALDGADLTWKRGLEILSTRHVSASEVERAVCEEWRVKGAHTAPSDPKLDGVVVHVENRLNAGEIVPYLSAVQQCTRRMPDGSEGRALTLTFSVR